MNTNTNYLRIVLALFAFLILLTPLRLGAQFYSQGQDPSGINWKQIQTENFQIIFPSDYTEQAQYIADVLGHVYEFGTFGLDHKPRKISVIVHNRTVVPNGFVAWAPKRVELYTTPPQTNDTHDWMESLIVHEFRHVVQVDKLNQGMTKVISWLFGEQGTGAVLGLYVPLWFLEGDAIVAETSLTNSGRGSLPGFEKTMRAQVLDKEIYSFDKAVFGSYKDYVPNHYVLGYQLVANAYSKYGKDAWEPVLTNVARRPYSIIPFSRGMKKSMGLSKDGHYKNTMTFLDSAWTEQAEKTRLSEITHIPTENNLYTDYEYIFYLNNKSFLALRSGLKDIPKVVKVDMDGNEEVLFTPGRIMPNSFNYSAGKIVWSEFRPDARWEHRNWAEIHIYDTKTGKRNKISEKTKWFAPVVSPDGKRIAVVEADENNKYALVIIDAETGEETNRFVTDNNDFLMTPAWNGPGDKIAVIALDSRGKRIDIVNLLSGHFETVLKSTHVEISRPKFWGPHLVFNGAFSGIDNIYYLDIRNQIVNLLVSSEYAAMNLDLSPSGMEFAFSDYTADGFKIGVVDIVDVEGVDVNEIENYAVNFYKEFKANEKQRLIPDNIERNNHEVKSYSKFLNLFRLHSWAPLVVDAERQELRTGASMLFHNDLSTSFLFTGYEYDMNERQGKIFVDYSYYGLYPVFSFYYERGGRAGTYLDRNSERQKFQYTQQSYIARSFVPLSFNFRQFFYGVTPSVAYQNILFSPAKSAPSFIETQNIHSVEYRAFAYIYRSSVKRDIRPKLGQIFDFSYRHGLEGQLNLGEAIGFRSTSFLPGLLSHNSLRLIAGYQEFKPGNSYYQYQSFLNYPRGITGQRHEELIRASADYAFPFAYPDWSVKYLFYIQRFSANLFFDYALGKRTDNNGEYDLAIIEEEFITCGIDIMADLHFLRFIAPMRIGPRAGYNLKSQQPFFEFLFSVTY